AAFEAVAHDRYRKDTRGRSAKALDCSRHEERREGRRSRRKEGPANVKGQPNEQWRPPAETIRGRPAYELSESEAAEVDAYNQLAVVAAGHPESAANLRQRRQHDVDSQGRKRHEQCHQGHKLDRSQRKLSRLRCGSLFGFYEHGGK